MFQNIIVPNGRIGSQHSTVNKLLSVTQCLSFLVNFVKVDWGQIFGFPHPLCFTAYSPLIFSSKLTSVLTYSTSLFSSVQKIHNFVCQGPLGAALGGGGGSHTVEFLNLKCPGCKASCGECFTFARFSAAPCWDQGCGQKHTSQASINSN